MSKTDSPRVWRKHFSPWDGSGHSLPMLTYEPEHYLYWWCWCRPQQFTVLGCYGERVQVFTHNCLSDPAANADGIHVPVH